ncbi:MAG TPA: transposase [Planctomycetota bacterium]|jgi:transposase
MALGEKQQPQPEFWIATEALAKAPGHPFYKQLNQVLAAEKFDSCAEDLCRKFYKEDGRPGIPPGVYFRMLLIGYFEGLDSERGIAWRCQDSLSLRAFLGYALNKDTPDHSSLSRIRQRIDLETHQELFTFVLKLLAKADLVSGKTTGIDATTLEANAALRSIVRRDTGEKYQDFLIRLAKESGIETPTREDLAKLDRKRPHKGSNDDWKNPHDPDAKITKMKDGSTHLAHKAEHAVDMDSGAVLAVTLQAANLGDTTTVLATVAEAAENMLALQEEPEAQDKIHPNWLSELVTDKGYHSNETLMTMAEDDIRTYIPEPERGQRNWENKEEQKKAVYSNRRRIKGTRGKALLRKRGELVERTFAHCYESGAMRRTHLRGHANILKRLLIQVCGFNLGLILRKLIGHGTPKELAERLKSLVLAIFAVIRVCAALRADRRDMTQIDLVSRFGLGRIRTAG